MYTSTLVWVCGISTTVGYLMPNHFHTHEYMISKHILKITFLKKTELIFFFFFGSQLNGFTYFQTIQFIARSAGAVEYTDCTTSEG